MGLSNKAQAAAGGIRAGNLRVGTYIATTPAPDTIKIPLATVAYLSGHAWFLNQRSHRWTSACTTSS